MKVGNYDFKPAPHAIITAFFPPIEGQGSGHQRHECLLLMKTDYFLRFFCSLARSTLFFCFLCVFLALFNCLCCSRPSAFSFLLLLDISSPPLTAFLHGERPFHQAFAEAFPQPRRFPRPARAPLRPESKRSQRRGDSSNS
jgi:hypothetical protein